MKPFAIIPFLLFTNLALNARANEKFDIFLKKRVDAARDIALELRQLQTKTEWCKAAEHCNDAPCLPSSCSGGAFGESFKCSSRIKIERQKSVCKGFPTPERALLNLDTAFLCIDADKTSNGGEGGSITINEPSVRRDVCIGKRLRHSLKTVYERYNLSNWIYGGTSNGVQITYPGYPRNRTGGYSTCNFNPITRPWYKAASGPKDVIFLLDKTRSSDHGPLNSRLGEALLNVFSSFDRFDNVAVVAFDDVEATTLGGKEELRSATKDFLKDLNRAVKQIFSTTASPNAARAFRKAFELFAKKNESCTRLIVLLSLQEDACFASCQNAGSDCRCVENLQATIARGQETINEPNPSIITFTEPGGGDKASDMINRNNMERLARTIACDKEDHKLKSGTGIWKRVISDLDTKDTAMETYTQMLAAPRLSGEDEGVIISPIYIDEGGLGRVVSISRRVSELEYNWFVGVVGVDVSMKEMVEEVGEIAEELIEKKAVEGRRCRNKKVGLAQCDVQFIRRSQRNSAECTNMQPAKKCYKYKNELFVPMAEVATWSDARDRCQMLAIGAALPVVSDAEENRFLSQLSSSDASWLGLRSRIGEDFISAGSNATKIEYKEFSSLYNETAVLGHIHDKMHVDACVTIDRRGITENWNVEPCSVLRRFICHIPATSHSVCGGEVHNYAPPSCTAFGDSGRKCTEAQDRALEKVNPVCEERNTTFELKDRICCASASDRSKKPATNDGGLSPVEIGIIFFFVGMIILIVASVVIYLSAFLVRKRRGYGKEESDNGSVSNEQSMPKVSMGYESSPSLPLPPFPPAMRPPHCMYPASLVFTADSTSGGLRNERTAGW